MSKKDILQKIKNLDNLTPNEKACLVELISAKKYGLVWENKPEKVEEQLRQNLPILKEVKEKYIKASPLISPLTPEGNSAKYNCLYSPLGAVGLLGGIPNHILIEGDNLHTLTAPPLHTKTKLMLFT